MTKKAICHEHGALKGDYLYFGCLKDDL